MRVILLFILMAFATTLCAQKFEEFSLVIGYDKSASTITAGYSDVTTEYYDEEYENDLPPFPPPTGILSTFRIIRKYDNGNEEKIFVDTDYRATPENDIDTLYYELDILGVRDEGIEFNMYVPRTNLSDKFSEIRITDDVSKGKFIDSNLIEGDLFRIENRFIDEFTIRVIVDKNRTNVEDIRSTQEYQFIDNQLLIKNINVDKIAIYNVTGTKIGNRYVSGNRVNLDYLQAGLYFIHFYRNDNVVSSIKIVKL